MLKCLICVFLLLVFQEDSHLKNSLDVFTVYSSLNKSEWATSETKRNRAKQTKKGASKYRSRMIKINSVASYPNYYEGMV